MAYITLQQPLYKEMPVGTDWVYSVNDSNNTQYKFKYILEIWGGSTGGDYLGLFKFSPNNLGNGIIKVNEILEQYVNSDNLGSIYPGIESAFKGLDNVAGSECAIHCIDKVSLSTNNTRRFTLKFGSEWASTPTVSPTQYLAQNTFELYLSFNGVAYNNEGKYLGNNYGINLDDWNNNSYLPLSNTSKFLTDAPTTPLYDFNYGQFIGDNDYATLAFLTGKFANTHPKPSQYKIQFFDNTNTFISEVTTQITPANGGYNTAVDTTLEDAEKHLQYIGVGTANMKGAGITIPTNWNSYLVFLQTPTNTVTYAYTYFKQGADCKGFEKIRLTWLNKYGVWDYYNFTKKNTRTTDIDRTEFNKVKGNWNGSKYVKHGYQRGRSILNSNATETISLNSDWFRSDEEAAWLEQLFISPEVYILKGYDATDTAPADFGEYMIPVIVTNKSYDKYTEANDKVAQYNLDIEYAINKRIQRG